MSTSDDLVHDSPADAQPSPSGTGPDAPPATDSAGPAPGAPRAMISVAKLAAHPGNVRRDLDLSPEFIESIGTNGVLTALRITPDGDNFRVIDGCRRLAGALKADVDQVPYDLVAERAGDEAGQYLDMINMNQHHNPLTPLEEADALFAAKEAGAPKTRIRKAAGLTSAGLTNALSAAKLSKEARARMQDLDAQLTLDELAVLTEFDGDPDAIARLTIAASCGTLEHEAELVRQARAEDAEHERIRGELEKAGYAITEILPANAQHLTVLSQDREDLTPETHATCPGRGVFFRFYDPLTPVHYCANPDLYGHAFRRHDPAAPTAASGAAGSPAPSASPPEPAEPDPSRRLVIQGNREWKAAAEVRKRWLATHLFTRRTAPREAAQYAARQLLTMPEPLRAGLSAAHSMVTFSELTGRQDRDWLEMCDTAPAGRLPLAMLAPIATAYEHAMTDGEGKNTWRTDRYSPCPRREAASYLTFLVSVGYQLSAIEQAVADMTPYTGETPPGDPITGETGQPTASDDNPVDPGDEPGPTAAADAGGGDGTGQPPAPGDVDDGTGPAEEQIAA